MGASAFWKMANKIVLGSILITGLILRLSGLWYGLPSKNRALTTYHPDEPISYYSLERMKPSKLNFHPGDGFFWGSMHLYSLGFCLQMAKILNVIQIPSRQYLINHIEMADRLYVIGRLLSIIFGMATVFLVYILCNKFWDHTVALTPSFLLALCPAHIFNSFVVRPDVMMVFFGMGVLYYSYMILEYGLKKFYILAGLLSGFAAATKYNGGAFVLCALIAHFLMRPTDPKFLWIIFFSIIGFLVGCPYALIDFKTFINYLALSGSLSKDVSSTITYGPGWKSYITIYLPHALGCIILLLGIAGFLLITFRLYRHRDGSLQDERLKNSHLLFLISTLIIYLVSCWPGHQMVWYTLPVVPFFIISASYFLKISWEWLKKYKLGWLWIFIFIAILIYNGAYSFAHLNLYIQKNTRELASEWIDKNIPQGKIIGIARSYFWTPGILRQYHPPYQLIEGGNSQSLLDDAILGLERVSKQINYIVITEYEYRTYLHPLFSSKYPEQVRVIQTIMNKDFIEIARFDKEAKFLWFKFQKGDFPPYDWIMPNPTIRIFKTKREYKI